MASAVVRCPTCLGDSQVDAGALGLTVRCPRCDATFIAAGQAEPAPRAPRNPTLSAPEPRPRKSRRRRERERDRERRPEPAAAKPESELDHDPHRQPPGVLPASVLIGLALLPFAIPILWLIAPAATGVEPAMSIATPTALAVSTSILCLAVIYTIDWTPATRVKGVLMLVGLAYFGATSLYFLKKQIVERFKSLTGLEEKVEWQEFKGDGYIVKLPNPPTEVPEKQIPLKSIKLKCHTAGHQRIIGRFDCVVGSYRFPEKGDVAIPDGLVDQLTKEIVARSRVERHIARDLRDDNGVKVVGRELELHLPKSSIRVVRFFVRQGSLYYLSVEGLGMSFDDPHATEFFRSFKTMEPAGQAAPR